MKKLILGSVLLLLPRVALAIPNNGVTVNSQGAADVCVAVTTSAAVKVIAGDANRTSVTLYCSQNVNCEPGTPSDAAPTVTPTTGAVGTGKGFPFVQNSYFTWGPNRALALGTLGATRYLPPGDRLDCIAQTVNGNCCSWEQY